MIEFHAGAGPDSQAVGIALEEGFFDYRIVPGGPALSIADGAERFEGASAILAHLAHRAGWPLAVEARPWLAWTGDMKELDRRLAAAPFILGAFSIADMAVWPRVLRDPAMLAAHPGVARWSGRMSLRTACGRGLGAISAAGRSR